MKQYAAIDDTVYFWFAGNDTSGSGGDGASPAADVRLAGAAAGAAPVYSPTPSLLSHASYPAGAHEIAITASAANGFAVNNTYAVFCTLAIDSQNPTGFVGSFDTKPVESNTTQIGDSAQSLTDLKDFADAGYDPGTNKVQGVVLTDTVTTYTGNTKQTANNNTILAHADYGLAKLVRSTTPANKLDVSATGEAGLDFANIKDATGAHTLTNITVPTVTDLTNAATNGDLTATMKTSVNTEADTALTDYDPPTDTEMVAAFTEIKGATWAAGTDTLEHIRNKQTDIETDTGEIGVAGAGLTDLGGMSTGMKAEVESEANDALVAQKLDHLVAVADADDAVNDSIIAKLAASDGDWSGFSNASDSLEAIRDRGDAAWTTGAGGSDRLLMVDTTIATLASQTSFTLTAGSADDDAYNNCTIIIEDVSTATQKAMGIISNYTGASKTITLKYDPAIFTMATTDKVYILAENALKATLANRQLNVAADGDIAGNVDGSVASVVGHTAQTGDSYAVVNHADHGNAKLVRSTTPANKLDVSATGEAGLDFANINDATGAHTLTNITVPTVTDLTNAATNGDLTATMKTSVNTEADTALTDYDPPTDTEMVTAFTEIKGATWAAGTDTLEHIRNKQTDIETDTAAILFDTGTDGVLLAATATSAQLIDDIWDEILTGATHNIATSAGRRLREIAAFAIYGNTAAAGSAVTITLDGGASANDGVYNRNLIAIVGGTGAGQTRQIADYVGSTKVVTVDREWRINPDATSEFVITASNVFALVDQGQAQAGTSTTITLRSYASSINDTYLCNQVAIIAGTGRGQSRLIGAYNGATKVATICGDNWITNPDATSTYVLLPYGTTCTSCIGTHALGLINTECDTALTDYDPPTRTEATTDKDAIIVEVDANETKIDTLQTDSTAIKAKTDNLPSGIAKNVALPKFTFLMVLSSDHVTGATGKTVTGVISKDGGSFASITNAITEVSGGMYKIASGFTQAEMNADVIDLVFSETDCDDRVITIHTS